MMFDSQHDAGSAQGATAFEPMERSSAAAKKSLRGRSGALLTSTALVAAGAAMMAGEAGAQVGVPTGFAPAPADVVSYVQLSNGSVLVQLANQQSLLVTSNNFFIDGTGVLYLSPTVTAGITGGPVASGAVMGAGTGGAVGLPAPSAPMGTTNVGSTSTGGRILDSSLYHPSSRVKYRRRQTGRAGRGEDKTWQTSSEPPAGRARLDRRAHPRRHILDASLSHPSSLVK